MTHQHASPWAATRETEALNPAVDVHAILRDAEAAKVARAAQMPTEQDCLRMMTQVVQRLRELGWRDAIYCPKDGSSFKAIEAGSTGIHNCIYMGDWPKGGWWIQDAGDLWPSRPILFKSATDPLIAGGKT